MRYLPLEQLVEYIKEYSTEVSFSKQIIPYWKRSYEYSSDNRINSLQEINFIVKGRIYGTIDNQSIELNSGDLFWIRPSTPHSLTWQKDLIYFAFRFSFIDRDEEITIDRPFLVFQKVNDLEHLCRSIAYTLKKGDEIRFAAEQLKAYFLLLTIRLANYSDRHLHPGPLREFTETEKRAIYSCCISREFKGVDSTLLSNELNMSRDYFSRLFKNTFGKSPKEWIFEEKMRFAAKMLIDSEISTNELSDLFGYTDVYLFSRQFKKVLGLTPHQYRLKNMVT